MWLRSVSSGAHHRRRSHTLQLTYVHSVLVSIYILACLCDRWLSHISKTLAFDFILFRFSQKEKQKQKRKSRLASDTKLLFRSVTIATRSRATIGTSNCKISHFRNSCFFLLHSLLFYRMCVYVRRWFVKCILIFVLTKWFFDFFLFLSVSLTHVTATSKRFPMINILNSNQIIVITIRKKQRNASHRPSMQSIFSKVK